VTALVLAGCAEDAGDARSGAPDDEAPASPPPASTDGPAAGDAVGPVDDTTVMEGGRGEVALLRSVSRPDLTPPVVDVSVADVADPGLVFLAPKKAGVPTGPLIVDDDGHVVWAHPRDDSVSDFKVQTYRGEPVITWWEGRSRGWGVRGRYTIMDRRYEVVAHVAPGDGLAGDLHEMQLTDAGTALMLVYDIVPADLRAVDGPEDGYLLDNRVREVDVESGEVLFDWRASDHIALADSDEEIGEDSEGTEDDPFDAFHLNSIDVDRQGALLLSARHTHAVYSIDRATGAVRWRLGGRSSDFAFGPGAEFRWQHDARRLPDGTISLLDNRSADDTPSESRALVLAVDERARRATVAREITHPDGILARTQANTQVLPSGGVFVGWGSAGAMSEFSPAGDLVFDASIAPADSYRAFRFAWEGTPSRPPDVAAARVGDGRVAVYASWNGATRVAAWRVSGGAERGALRPLTTVDVDGFETRAVVDDVAHVAVAALDADGNVLGRSATVAPTGHRPATDR
jgi:hypothetical protein